MIASRLGLRRLASVALALLLVLVGMLALSAAPVLAVRGHILAGSFGEEGTANGQFKTPEGVAVNEATGQVYVADRGNERVERFSSEGAYEAQFNTGSSGQTTIAVDNSCELRKLAGSACEEADPSNGDVYVASKTPLRVQKYSPGGTLLGELPMPAYENILGVAVDREGTVWVYFHMEGQYFAGFTDAASNELLATVKDGSEGPQNVFENQGLAVDGEGNFYPVGGNWDTHYLSKLNGKGEQLIEKLDEEHFSYGPAVDLSNNDVYVTDGTAIASFTPEGALADRFGSGELGQARDIAVDAQTNTLYVTDSAQDSVHVFAAQPPGVPAVASEWALAVNAENATLQAEVNPSGASTVYQIEYGSCASVAACASSGYEAALPAQPQTVGSDFGAYTLTIEPAGLRPSTAYHYRVLLTNEFGTVDGQEEVIVTEPPGAALQLLDGRQWEQVSPENKHGAAMLGLNEIGTFRSSVDGRNLSYLATRPTEAQPAGYSNNEQLLSRRSPAGWSSHDVSPANTAPNGLENEPQYLLFSEDLSRALVYPNGENAPSPLSTSTSSPTPYLREQATCELAGEGPEGGCYRPLATTKEPYADIPPGTELGGKGRTERMSFAGATPDMNHIYLSSPVALTEAPALAEGQTELYEWSAQRPAKDALRMISILPESEGGGVPEGEANSSIGEEGNGTRNSISQDGSRVFFAVAYGSESRLYMRDTLKNETVRLDVKQPGAPAGGGPFARFQFASRDGSRVFFRDGEKLTDRSGGGGETSGDLYECRIVEEEGSDACRLSDLTPVNLAGEEAHVGNILPGAGEDGSYVYFVADSVLANGASPGDCYEQRPHAMCDLYVYHEGETRFIAALAGEDETDWGESNNVFHSLGNLTAQASPDGRYLAFMSILKPTGYDNRSVGSGKPAMEVYLYDAESEHLSCISCDPTGARPAARKVEAFLSNGASNYAAVPDGSAAAAYRNQVLIAANLPHGDVVTAFHRSLLQPRFVMNGGRVFFNAVGALAPQDTNGGVDAYEYEPAGAGSCSSVSVSFSELDGGCVSLVSSGTGAGESGFLEASEGGNDVFFLTGEQLVRGDRDTAYDVYDARVCTGVEPCPSEAAAPPACASASACRQAPSSQPSTFGAPPSATFSGEGNLSPLVRGTGAVKAPKKTLTRAQKLRRALKVCRKDRAKRKRARCEKNARAKYGVRAKRSASKPKHAVKRRHAASKRGR